jgi:DNA-binding beta-propeller fold protein YncE
MKLEIFRSLLVLYLLLGITSCKGPTTSTKSETKSSTESTAGYRELLGRDVPPSPSGQNNGLQGVAVDNQGQVYVADAQGRRVLVYTSDGTLARRIEPDARHPKILRRPYGLLFDGRDRLYVTDYDADQIQVFTTEGKFLFAWGREGKGKGEFRAPVGIAQGTFM